LWSLVEVVVVELHPEIPVPAAAVLVVLELELDYL
jgi:hypothetical protein